ncbi:MAG: hypothetical protein AAFX87_30325 [Bacteroidota bacterium]
MRKLVKTLIFILGIISADTFAQSGAGDEITSPPTGRQIIPPSPEAAALGKFASFPVSKYTGVPNINIPLYEIRSRDISIPINISYHASGIKIEEEASWVGLNWILNTGGTITRSTRGLDDFINEPSRKGFPYSPSIPSQEELNADYTYLEDVCIGRIDSEPDIFYYNFLGYSGKFILKNKNNPEDEITVFNQGNLNIRFTFDESSKVWTLWTPDGFKYVFQTKEYTENWSASGYHPLGLDEPEELEFNPDVNQTVISSWLLDRIISPLGEEVTFEYNHVDHNTGRSSYASQSVVSLSESRAEPISFSVITGDLASCPNYNTYTGSMMGSFIHYLEAINFTGGRMVFHKSDREDMLPYHHRYDNVTYQQPQRLEAIEVLNNVGGLIRRFDFQTSYFGGNVDGTIDAKNKRLRLDGLLESGNGVSKEPYKFEYESGSLPSKDSYARDHWGYYNGAQNSSAGPARRATLIPPLTFNGADGDITIFEGADRESNEQFAKIGMLKKIIFPTKGETHFNYESHTFNADDRVDNLPKKFFIANVDTQTGNYRQAFELTERTTVKITGELKYNCTNGPIQPSHSDINVNHKYIKIVNIDTGDEVFVALESDLICLIENRTNCGSISSSDYAVSNTGCGILIENDEYNLEAGRYMIVASTSNEILNTNFKVEYELNQRVTSYADNVITKGGGLRIKEMKDFDGFSFKNIRKYNYNYQDNDGVLRSAGREMSPPTYFHTQRDYQTVERDGGGDLTSGHSGGLHTSLIYCTYIMSGSSTNIPLGASAQGNFIGYDQVTEIIGENGEGGQSTFYYHNEPDENMLDGFVPGVPAITHSFSNGLLTKEEHFDWNCQIVKEVVNQYQEEVINPVEGLRLMTTGACQPVDNNVTFFEGSRYDNLYEWWKLTSTEEKVYDRSNPDNIKVYTYSTSNAYENPIHKQLTSTTFVDSHGRSVRTTFSYALDNPSVVPSQMIDVNSSGYKHMPNYLVREMRYQEDIPLYGLVNHYDFDPSSDKILLDKVDQSLNGITFFNIVDNKYDNRGSLIERVTKGDDHTSYIWAYQNTLPVAEIRNASAENVFYTGFENHTADFDARTGNVYWLGASYTIQECGTDTPFCPTDPSSLLMSYWYRDNGQWLFSGEIPYNPSINLLSGNAIDDIRVYPQGAQMTTYTYNFLGEITSVTDHNNVTQYYEYDGLQRLDIVRDNDKNKLNEYKYQYKQD